jgi:hypothetical protein
LEEAFVFFDSPQCQTCDPEFGATLHQASALPVTETSVNQIFRVQEEFDILSAQDIRENRALVDAAIQKELKSWADCQVTRDVPVSEAQTAGLPVVPTTWVLRWKEIPASEGGGRKVKARLCVRGDRDPQKENVETDSPTACRQSQRLWLHLAACRGWTPRSIDISTAFLNGAEFDGDGARQVYVRPPVEARVPETHIWRLLKPAYGLADAPKRWWQRLSQALFNLPPSVVPIRVQRNPIDPCVFSYFHAPTSGPTKLIGIITTHVDDLGCAGDALFDKAVLDVIRSTFPIGAQQSGTFKHTGLDICQKETHIEIGQATYIQSLRGIELSKERRSTPDAALSPEELSKFRSSVAAVAWASQHTQPQLAFATSHLQSQVSHATVRSVLELNSLVKKAHAQASSVLKMSPVSQPERFVAYTDAARQNAAGHGSQGAYLIFLTADKGDSPANLIDHCSRRLKRVCVSSLGAETLAAAQCIDQCQYLQLLYHYMQHLVEGPKTPAPETMTPIDVYTDCRSLMSTCETLRTPAEKRLLADIALFRDLLREKAIRRIDWLPTEDQLADSLTKAMSTIKLQEALSRGHLSASQALFTLQGSSYTHYALWCQAMATARIDTPRRRATTTFQDLQGSAPPVERPQGLPTLGQHEPSMTTQALHCGPIHGSVTLVYQTGNTFGAPPIPFPVDHMHSAPAMHSAPPMPGSTPTGESEDQQLPLPPSPKGRPHDVTKEYYTSAGYLFFPIKSAQLNDHALLQDAIKMVQAAFGGSITGYSVDGSDYGSITLGTTSASSKNPILDSFGPRFYIRGVTKFALREEKVLKTLGKLVDLYEARGAFRARRAAKTTSSFPAAASSSKAP